MRRLRRSTEHTGPKWTKKRALPALFVLSEMDIEDVVDDMDPERCAQ